MNTFRRTYKINDNLTLYGAFWPTLRARANVLLVTGMEEHALRYTEFAKFLNGYDLDVYCVDYYGQGENITKGGHVKGEVPDHAFSTFVDNLAVVATDIKKDGLPLFIIGHSMGSFLTQHFIQKHPKLVDKAVIIGSNGPSLLFGFGKLVALLTTTKNNRNNESKLLAALSIGAYQKQIKNAKTQADWLSYDEDNVNSFITNPLDGGPSSKGFYLELLRGTSSVYRSKNLINIDRNFPIFIIGGEHDPVSSNAKGLYKLHQFYLKHDFKKVSLKVYSHMRHEILNESKREQVYNDILMFLSE